MTLKYRLLGNPEALDEFVDSAKRDEEPVDISITAFIGEESIEYYESVAHAGGKELLIFQMRPPYPFSMPYYTSRLVIETSAVYAHYMDMSGLQVTIKDNPWRMARHYEPGKLLQYKIETGDGNIFTI